MRSSKRFRIWFPKIEFSLVEKDVVFGLRQGNEALAQLNKEMNIESVEKLMEDTAEAIAYQKEISEMLQRNMSLEEEEDVQTELAALQRETEAKSAISHPPVQFPLVPVTEPAEPGLVASKEGPKQTERVALPAA